MPVAGIGEQHPRRLSHTGRLELAAGGVDDRLEMPEVSWVNRDLGSIITIWFSSTAACALYPWMYPRVAFSRRESGSVTFIFPAGTSGGVYAFGDAPSLRPFVSRPCTR